jgi:branched-chain amino acid transport system substrate-binding protein
MPDDYKRGKNMKRIYLVTSLLVFGIVSAHANDLAIGYLAANTGPFSALAKRNAVAVEIAIEDINAKGGINGKKLVLSSFDTGGKPDQAAAGVTRFAQDEPVLAIVGPFSTSECRVSFPAGERLGIPQMSMASSAPKVAAPFTYAFRNTTDEAYTYERLFKTIKAKGYAAKSVSIAYATDDAVSESLGTKVLPDAIKQAGLPLEQTVSLRVAAFDLAPQVSQLMQKPTDLIAVGTPPEPMLKLAAELRRQGHKGRMLGGSSVADAELPARMGPNGEGTLITATFFSGLDDERTRDFVEKFKAKLKEKGEAVVEPNQFDAASYDIVSMYAYAMQQAAITGDRDRLAAERTAVRDQIRKLSKFPALVGPLSINSDGDAIKVVYVLEAKGGKWTLVDRHLD